MGYFRRFKLTDHTADECRKNLDILEDCLSGGMSRKDRVKYLEQWACFRELLARHEKKNESPLDE